MSTSAFAPEAYADDADEMDRLINGPDADDHAIRPEGDIGWRWRVVAVFIALAAFSAAVLTIR